MTSNILQSLINGPLLVGDLPEAPAFDHRAFDLPPCPDALNFNQKLGHLYEDALSRLLGHSPRFQLLERNLQIQKDPHSTLGELDFLIRDLRDRSLIHLELATKFYLVVRDGPDISLPGPDARDNYHRKLSRLRDHQLRMIQKHRQDLPGDYQKEKISTRHLIYGCLFDPISESTPFSPEFISPSARRGKWLTIDDFRSRFPHPPPLRVIPKPLWPVPPDLLDTMPLEEFTTAAPLERCTMILSPCGKSTWFITPSAYPNHPR